MNRQEFEELELQVQQSELPLKSYLQQIGVSYSNSGIVKSCGRYSPIVRSIFFALTSQCEGIVRSLQELLPVGERIRFVGLLESP